MQKVLLIEDSKEIFTMVNLAIGTVAQLHWADNLKAAGELLAKEQFSLVLLDIELPDGSGIDFCSQLQARFPGLPIFMLTSHKELSDKVLGFSAGADDYITKPFVPLELRARVESRLRKIEVQKISGDILKWQEIEIDKNRQEVRILSSGKFEVVSLTALEFKILTYLAATPGHVIPRDQVLNDIWGEDVHVYPRSVDTHISKIRRKLGDVSHIIESIHGTGYKFCPNLLA